MRASAIIGVSLCLFVLIVVLSPSLQSTADNPACETLFADALDRFEASCNNTPGGSACYGYPQAGARFVALPPALPFAQAGDTLSLQGIEAVTTGGLDLETETWGLSAINVWANVPLAISDRGVKYVLLGDVDVENRVPQEDAYEPGVGVPVMPLVGANLRTQPNLEAAVVTGTPAGSTLVADGVSADGAWLHVSTAEGVVAWVNHQIVVLAEERNLDSLPVLQVGEQSLMQSICLRTGTEEASACSAIPPSLLLVQTPGKVLASLTVNGVDIAADATFVLRTEADNMMRLIVLSGTVHTGGVSVPQGFTMRIELAEEGCDVSGQWRNLRPIAAAERALLQGLERIPGGLLDYVVEIPTESEIAAIQRAVLDAGRAEACAAFRPTSPVGGLPYGTVTFYWDGLPEVTNYRLILQDSHGQITGPFETGSSNTNLTLDTPGFNGGPEFNWYVEALIDDEVICASEMAPVVLSAPPPQNVPAGGRRGGSRPEGGATSVPPTATPGPPVDGCPPPPTPEITPEVTPETTPETTPPVAP